MKAKIKEPLKNSTIRKIAGAILVVVGLVFVIMPVVPGAWLFIVGLELLGLRLIFQNKLKCFLGKCPIYRKLSEVKEKILK